MRMRQHRKSAQYYIQARVRSIETTELGIIPCLLVAYQTTHVYEYGLLHKIPHRHLADTVAGTLHLASEFFT